jgi:hypothetical protein
MYRLMPEHIAMVTATPGFSSSPTNHTERTKLAWRAESAPPDAEGELTALPSARPFDPLDDLAKVASGVEIRDAGVRAHPRA